MVKVKCVICGKEADITGNDDGSYDDLNLTEANMTKVFGRVVCISEAKDLMKTFEVSTLRDEIELLKNRISTLEKQ